MFAALHESLMFANEETVSPDDLPSLMEDDQYDRAMKADMSLDVYENVSVQFIF